MQKGIAGFLLFLCFPSVATSQYISGELWINESLEVPPGYRGNLQELETKTEYERQIVDNFLEDVRWIISGMIYGFDIQWIPSFKIKGIDEFLDIRPVAMIPRGDPRLHIIATVRENGTLYVWLNYDPDMNQKERIKAWQSLAKPTTFGTGLGSLYGEEGRRYAMKVAMKDALWRWFRLLEYNRPQKIHARMALLEFPRIQFIDGNFHATLTVSMEIKALIPYRIQ